MSEPPELGISLSFLQHLERRGALSNIDPANTSLIQLGVIQIHEGVRESGKRLTAELRRALGDTVERNAPRLGKAADVLRRWADEQNIEGLAEWLDRGGKVDDAKLEAPFVAAAEATVAAKGSPAGVSLVMQGEGAALLAYAVPPGVSKGKAWQPIMQVWEQFYVAAFDLIGLRDAPPVVLTGVDALRAGLHAHDWAPLANFLHDDDGTDWLRVLAKAWINARKPHAEAEAEALPLAIREKAWTTAGDKWTPIVRGLEIASALGGPLEVNGERYAQEPALAADAVALRPRNLDVVPADWLDRPAQMRLGFDAPAVEEYLLEVSARTATLARLPNMTPKLLGLMFGVTPQTDRMVKCTLGELARMLYPDWKDRRATKHDLETVGAAFVAVKGLRLIAEKPNGVRHPYDLFVMNYDLAATADAELGFALNPFLVERMQGGAGTRGGFFLLNMTRWLAMSTQKPRLFPLALRLAAIWDQARVNGFFDPSRLRSIEADRLLTLCNTLPPAAAEYRHHLTRSASAKTELAKARAALEADLDALEAAGLLGNWRPTQQKIYGKGWNLVPTPPNDYAEACKQATKAVREHHRTRTKG